MSLKEFGINTDSFSKEFIAALERMAAGDPNYTQYRWTHTVGADGYAASAAAKLLPKSKIKHMHIAIGAVDLKKHGFSGFKDTDIESLAETLPQSEVERSQEVARR